MSKGYITPTFGSSSFNCPHCGTLTHQYWIEIRGREIEDGNMPFIGDDEMLKRLEQLKDDDDRAVLEHWREEVALYNKKEIFSAEKYNYDKSGFELKNFHLSKCYTCKKYSIWKHKSLIDPINKNEIDINDDLPEDIKYDFNEAIKIYKISPRGAAALMRLCIQKLCVFLGEKGINLNDDISSLVAKGLNPKIQKSLDIVRFTGNEAVHPGELDLKDNIESAEQLFKLTNIIAQTMITDEKQVNNLYNSLPEQKREQIEARDRRVKK